MNKLTWIPKLATSLALILCVTAASRLLFGWHEIRKTSPSLLARVALQNEAGSIGRSLSQGQGFSNPYERETGPTAILSPVYPLIVAAVFKIFGVLSAASFRVLFLLNVLFATLTCIPLFHLGRRIGGLGVAATASWLWALFPNGVLIPFEWIWESSLSALLVVTLLWLTINIAESPSPSKWSAYGLLCGFALLTNPVIGAALPVLLPWAAWRTYSKTNWRGPALAFALALACCVPWTIRNYEVFHRLIPLRSGFGFELYIGNNENYAQPQMVWPPKVSYERELLRYVRLGEVAFMDEEKAKALAFIKSHSRIALELLAKRIVDFWIGTLTPFHILLTDTSWLDRFVVLCNFLLPVGVVAGLLLLLSTRSPLTLPLAVFPALFPLVYYLTHTSLRYRHAIDPCAFLLAAVALVAIFRRGIKPIDSAGAALVSS